ncbi:hypothetical protein PLESTB_001541000 [Pleodorina starrii]|uniref:PHD-type domain-containing protein n=1 Tax=Pleodorina starrii TaxID=330485 RepID=A0A9W6F8Q9_9CHLO|nr:hypothetical protein PLESTM_001933400 [Pleodorina starrii]GLC59836.1 hypothetical protein PLESTB_001541000 [Pleodorina starrii]
MDRNLQESAQRELEEEPVDDGLDQDDEAHPETYIGYRPSKVHEGRSHPDPIVETQALGAVVPPDPHYRHNLKELVDAGAISNAQLETAIYACMRFAQRLGCSSDGEGAAAGPSGSAPADLGPQPRAGFFLGDGAGVGKGRQIGAIIRECWSRGVRRVLWVSVSTDLRVDAGRDMEDTGCTALGVKLYPQGKNGAMPAAKDVLERHFNDGVLFCTYSLLIGKGSGVTAGSAAIREKRKADNERSQTRVEQDFRANPLQFYPPGSRLRQMVDWLQVGGDGQGECLIVFDECHRAKNLLLGPDGTQTGRAVEALQLALPNARVLYSSATGATEPQNLAYMLRLGHKGFESMRDLSASLQAAGLGALELFASGMKALGTYVGRTLSYSGAEFRVELADIEPEYRVMYDRAAELWQLLYKITENLPKFGDKRDSLRMSQFWSSHQRFFRLMLIACKVQRCAQLAREAVQTGHAVVIGLQSTGEANMDQVRVTAGNELDDFISSPQVQITNFVLRFFPTRHPGHIEVDTMALDRLVFQVKMALDGWGHMVPAREEVRQNSAYWGENTAIDVGRSRAAPRAASQAPAAATAAAGAAAAAPPVAAAAADVATPAPRRRGAAGNAFAAPCDSDDDILEVTEVPASANTARRPLQERQTSRAVRADGAPGVKEETARKPGGPAAAGPGGAARGGAGGGSPHDAIVIDDSDDDAEGAPVARAAATAVACAAAGPARAAAGGAGAAAGPAGAAAGPAGAAAGGGGAAAGGGQNGDDGDDVLEAVEVSFDDLLRRRREAALRRGDLIDLSSSQDDAAVRRLAEEMRREELRQQGAAREQERARAEAELEARQRELRQKLRMLRLMDGEEAHSDIEGGSPGSSAGTGPADIDEPGPKRHCARPAGAATACDACGLTEDGSCCLNPMLACCEVACHARLHLLCWDASATEKPSDWFCPECVAQRAQRRLAGAPEFKRQSTLARYRSDVAAASEAVEEAQRALQQMSLGAQHHQHQHQRSHAGGQGAGASVGGGGAGCSGAGGGGGAGGGSRHDAIDVDEDDYSLDSVLAAAATPAVAARLKKESPVGAPGTAPKRRGRPPKKEPAGNAAGGVGGGGGGGGGVAQTPGGGSGASYAVKPRALPLGVTEQMVEERGGLAAEDEEEDGGKPGVAIPQLASVRKLLLEFVGKAVELPPTPLDQLVQLLGGSEQVAEMTGRKGRLEEDADGKVRYQDRSLQLGEVRKRVNLSERKAFMDGKKNIAIISDAASTGVSLHANKTAPNQRRRFHITLELPWSADKAIQQFGRSHRANQASAPIYCLLVSKCGGEYRFAGSVARRLQSLGALLQGDRNALGATRDLKAFDVTSPWGKAAVQQLYFECKIPTEPAMQGVLTPLLPEHLRAGPMSAAQAARAVTLAAAAAAGRGGGGGAAAEADVPEAQRREYFMPYIKNCLTSVGLLKSITKATQRVATTVDHSTAGEKRVETFLNRLLGLPLADQQRVFDYFWQLTSAIVAHAKSTGIYDYGIQGLEGRTLTVRRLTTVHTEPGSDAKAFYAEVEADRGVPWAEALAAYEEAVRLCGSRPDHRIGFYVDRTGRAQGGTGRQYLFLATPCASERLSRRTITWFRMRKPNGAGHRGNKLVDWSLHDSYTKIPLQNAKVLWEFWYEFLRTNCIHGHNCSRRSRGEPCSSGQSILKHHIISGAVIPIWRQLEEAIAGVRHHWSAETELEEGQEGARQPAAKPGARHRTMDADHDHDDEGGQERGGNGGAGRGRGKRSQKRWPACVRVLAHVSPQVAARAQEAGMRLVGQQPQQPGANAAAAAGAAGPSNGGAAQTLTMGQPHQQQPQQASELLFVGLDLKEVQVRELLRTLEHERREGGRQRRAAAGAGAGAGMLQGGGAGAGQRGVYG